MQAKPNYERREYLPILATSLNCSIEEDRRVEAKAIQGLTEEFSENREGIHVSDLVLCMRKSLFAKLKPKTPTVKQLGYFLDGQRRHETLQKLYGEGIKEKQGEFEGVQHTIDIYDEDVPIEFKTSRASTAIGEHWVRQLVYYILATGSQKGILQIQRITPRKDGTEQNPFPAYLVQLNEEQRSQWLKDFIERRNQFQKALASKDPSQVPIYRGEGEWLCRECPWKRECDIIERRG